jgi:hypothetical protein
MSLFGTPAVHPVAGLNQAARATRGGQKVRADQTARRPADGDRLDLEVQTAEADDAVEGLGGNGDEQTAEDRQKQDHYRPQQKGPGEPRHIDVQG